jgi:chromosome segregation ATPase
MNRAVQYLNFLGVAALAVLCAFQWSASSRIDHQREQLASTCQTQSAKIAEDEQSLQADTASIDDLNQRLSSATDELSKTHQQIEALTIRCDQMKSALAKWTAAVAQRDAALKQAADEIQKAMADRDQAVKKYNDLAGQYNAMIAGQNRN